jgi:CHAD domain-containing protein
VDLLPLTAELRDRRANRADALLHRIQSRGTSRIRKQSRKLLERVRCRDASSDPGEQVGGLTFLRPVLVDFQSTAATDLTDVAELHRFRKCAKRVRYAVELLIPAEGGAADALKSLQAALEGLQDRLGGINDHAAATTLLSEIAGNGGDPHAVAAAGAQLAAEQAAFDAERDRFLAWWRTGGAESLLTRLP